MCIWDGLGVSKQSGGFSRLAELFLCFALGYGATAHLESGGFIRSRPGVPHPDIQFHFLPSQVIDHGRVNSQIEAFQVCFIQFCL